MSSGHPTLPSSRGRLSPGAQVRPRLSAPRHPALLEYITWLEEFNPAGTRVTPAGTLSSTFKTHFIAYIEIYDNSYFRLWLSTKPQEFMSPEDQEKWVRTLEKILSRRM